MRIVRTLVAGIFLVCAPASLARSGEYPSHSASEAPQLLLGGREFWLRLESDIAGARERVLVETMSFEGDSAGLRLAEALLRCPAPDRRILFDAYTELCLSDRFVYSPRFWFSPRLQAERRRTRAMVARLRAGGVEVRVTNDPGADPLGLLRRNHKKLVVVDSVSYLGGINFSDHNFEWHDLMLRFAERDLAAALTADFDSTWAGRNGDQPVKDGATEVYPLDGDGNTAKLRPLFELLGAARDSIWIESAYLTFPFYDALRAARARGVHVTHVAPLVNNKGIFDSYAIWEARRSGIELRHLPHMTHMKVIVVDGETVVGGSVNFDYMSTLTQQELLLITREPRLVRQVVDRVVRPDHRASRRYEGGGREVRGRLAYLQLLAVERVAATLRVSSQ